MNNVMRACGRLTTRLTRPDRRRVAGRRALRPLAEGLEDRNLMAVVGIDPDFGFGGLAPLTIEPSVGNSSQSGYIANIARQADGKLVAVGTLSIFTPGSNGGQSTETSKLLVARFNQDGSRDTSFGSNGIQSIEVKSGDQVLDSNGVDIAVQSNGQIVLLGSARTQVNIPNPPMTTINDFVVARVNANGSVDTGFGTNGYRLIDFKPSDSDSNTLDQPAALALAPDSKIVAAGYTTTPGHMDGNTFVAGSNDMAVARLNTDGSLDNSFDNDGKRVVAFDIGGDKNDQANGVIVQPDGKVVLVGAAQVDTKTITDPYTYNQPINDFAAARLNTDGSLDGSFDNDGKQTIAFNIGGNNSDEANSVAYLPGGKLLLVGKANVKVSNPSDFFTQDTNIIVGAQLNGNGSLDTGFQNGGKMFLTLAPGGILYNGEASSVQLLPNGFVLIGGSINSPSYGSSMATLAMLNPAGGFDPGFGFGGIALLPISMSTRVVAQPNGQFVYGTYGGLISTTRPPLPLPMLQQTTPLFQGSGRNARVTGLALRFNTLVNPLLASNLSTYRLTQGGRSAQNVPVGAVAYDPSTNTVTLQLRRALQARGSVNLQILAAAIVGPAAQVLNGGQNVTVNVPLTPPPTTPVA